MEQSNQQNKPQEVQLKISDEVLKGVYANMAQIGYTSSGEEFILDFINLVPPAGIVSSRVIVSPQHMKRILNALEDNLKRYEEAFGKIEAGQSPTPSLGFRTE